MLIALLMLTDATVSQAPVFQPSSAEWSNTTQVVDVNFEQTVTE